METYSIDSITKYISFYEIIKKRNAKYPFAIQIIQIKKLNLAFTCGFLWMFIQKIICFCLIRLVSKDLSFLLQIMMKTRSTNYFKILKVDQVKNQNFAQRSFVLKRSKKCLIKKRSVKRYGSKLFSFVRTICKIKKESLHEHLNIKKSNSRFNQPKLWTISIIFLQNLI